MDTELRIEKLEKQAEEFILRFNDIQDEHKALFARIDTYHADLQKQVRDSLDNLNERASELFRDVYSALDQIKQKFGARVKEEIARVTSEEIALALSSKVLLTRPATRAEIQEGKAVAVRQATSAELR